MSAKGFEPIAPPVQDKVPVLVDIGFKTTSIKPSVPLQTKGSVGVASITGNGFTVIDTSNESTQPLASVTITSNVSPSTPFVITGLWLFVLVIVASPSEDHSQDVPSPPVSFNVIATFSQTGVTNGILTDGNALTVTNTVSVQLLASVYVIIVVPAATPVTTPKSSTVAVAGVPETQGFATLGVPDPVKVTV